VLLVALAVFGLVTAFPERLPRDAFGLRLAMVALFAASLFVLSGHHRALRIGAAFAAVLVAIDWISPWFAPQVLRPLYLLLSAVFLAWICAAALREMLARDSADPDALLGAVCGYLLLVVLFTLLHALTERVAPGSYLEHGARLPQDPALLRAVLQYFSVVTITTLGYGDIQPVGAAARLLAGFEALTGQLYVATVIAALVGRLHLR
jgi:hypothetical protein